jgi:hypothetical protein
LSFGRDASAPANHSANDLCALRAAALDGNRNPAADLFRQLENLTDCCRLAGVLDQALTAFLTVLDQHTLASVALKPKDFRAVFQTARRPTASRQAHGGVPMRSILTGHHATLPIAPDKSADK